MRLACQFVVILLVLSGKTPRDAQAMPADEEATFKGKQVAQMELEDMSTDNFETHYYTLKDDQVRKAAEIFDAHVAKKQTKKLPPFGPTAHRFVIKSDGKTF